MVATAEQREMWLSALPAPPSYAMAGCAIAYAILILYSYSHVHVCPRAPRAILRDGRVRAHRRGLVLLTYTTYTYASALSAPLRQ